MPDTVAKNSRLRVGVISDTHGHLHPSAKRALAGVDAIIHAGDIGGPELLDVLRTIAPVTAVVGNMDGGRWISDLQDTEIVELGDVLIVVLHNFYRLDLDPEAAGFQAVIHGHTHLPEARCKNGVWYINPGSATFPKHGQSASVALIHIEDKQMDVKFINLDTV